MPGTILLEPIKIQSSTGNLLAITSTGRIETEIANEPTVSIGNIPHVVISSSGIIHTQVDNTPHVIVTSSGVVHTQIDNIPHVIITSSGTVPVNANQSGTWNINNISGTISRPTGAATSTGQATINTTLTTIDTDIKAAQPRKLLDGNGNIITSTSTGASVRALDINLRGISSGLALGSVKIEDKTTSAYKLIVNADGSINTTNKVEPPPNTIPIDYYIRGSVAGSSVADTPIIIPVNTTMYLQKFLGGMIPSTTDSSAIELWYSATGAIATSSELISLGYTNGSTNYSDDLNKNYSGDATKAVLLRRNRLDAGAKELYARLKGYLTYTTYTIDDSGNSTSTTASTLTDTTKAWVVNVHAGRYLMIQDINPLKIVSNTATVITLTTGHNISLIGIVAYKIITFNA